MNSNVVIFSTVQAFFISFLFSYFEVDIPLPDLNSLSVSQWIPSFGGDTIEEGGGGGRGGGGGEVGGKKGKKHRHKEKDPVPEGDFLILTPKELSHFDGQKGSKGLYLALLGKIYDVKKGKQHYGPNGGYHFFSGRDATRAFITGEFNEKGLIDDISGLQHQDLLGIEDWLQFYEKEYKFVGYLQGTYYDSKGRPTAKLKKAMKSIEAAQKWKEGQEEEAERFPPCNSEWSQGKGSRVWCTNKSGGIARDWVGVPRKLFKPGSSQSRCACIKNTGAAQDGSDPKGKKGDLDHPNLQEYQGCNPNAISCTIEKE